MKGLQMTHCGLHIKSVHESEEAGPIRTLNSNVDARKLNVKQLHDELRNRGLGTNGGKDHLIKRLRGALALEKQ